MSTLQTTFLKHPDAAGNQITFTSGGDVNFDNGAVYLDSTNNRLGIGTTNPGASLSVQAASDTEAIEILGRASDDIGTLSFFENDGTTEIGRVQARTTELSLRARQSGQSILFITNGVAERARIDSSGRLLVGTSSAATTTGTQSAVQIFRNNLSELLNLHLGFNGATAGARINLSRSRNTTHGQSTILQDGDEIGGITFIGDDGVDYNSRAARIFAQVDGTPGANDMPGRLVFSTTADGASSPTERMRIDSSGQVLINRSSGISDTPSLAQTHVYRSGSNNNYALAVHHDGNNSANYGIYVSCGQDAGNGWPMRIHDGNGTLVGSITFSGSSTAFNTSSDYRLKENVVDLDGAITRVKQLAPKRFNFIVDADTTVDGFLAHEAQTVVPEAVIGTKDEVDDDGNPVMQGIDQSKLVPLLTAALKEAISKIETLEQRLSDAGIA
jgi:hypothetical protein